MKNYTVKEFANMLGKNPETVRRWIRNGDLKATYISRKDGNVITDMAIKDFIKKAPQYAPFASNILSVTPATLGLALGAIVGAVAFAAGKSRRKVTPAYIKKHLTDEIEKAELNIEENTLKIEKLQKKVETDQKLIDNYKYVLANSDLEEIAEDINKNFK